MPTIAAYRNRIVSTKDDPHRLGQTEISLSPKRSTRGYTYDVELVRVRVANGYIVDWSQDGARRIFPEDDPHAKGCDLPTALDSGIAAIISEHP